MRNMLLFLTVIVMLIGCSQKDDTLHKQFTKLEEQEYSDITIKGIASIDIPKELIRNKFEEKLINKANNIEYYLNFKQTPNLNYTEGEVDLTNDTFNLSLYSNNKESLVHNGRGWHKFEDFSINEDKYLKGVYKGVQDLLLNKDFYSYETQKQDIKLNDIKYKTNMYNITITEEGLNNISKNNYDFEKIKLNVFSTKERVLVIQYDLLAVLNTDFDKDIQLEARGELLYNNHNKDDIKIISPEFDIVYDNIADFLIDLLLE